MASAPQPPRAASVSAQMPGLEKSVDNIVVKTKTNSLDSEGCWHRRLRNIYWTRRRTADGRKDGWTESEVRFGKKHCLLPLEAPSTP